MNAERDTFGPASLSILATRSSERLSEVFDLILYLYYRSRISARYCRSTENLWRCLPNDRGEEAAIRRLPVHVHGAVFTLWILRRGSKTCSGASTTRLPGVTLRPHRRERFGSSFGRIFS
jgi:hypothetical protein